MNYFDVATQEPSVILRIFIPICIFSAYSFPLTEATGLKCLFLPNSDLFSSNHTENLTHRQSKGLNYWKEQETKPSILQLIPRSH